MNRFLSLESRLQQYPNNTSDILREAGLTVDEYHDMKARYENTVSRVSNPSIVDNPNYKSKEEKMILFLMYLCCVTEPDYFQMANDNIDAYYEKCILIANDPKSCHKN